jgi:hypothetical protein
MQTLKNRAFHAIGSKCFRVQNRALPLVIHLALLKESADVSFLLSTCAKWIVV